MLNQCSLLFLQIDFLDINNRIARKEKKKHLITSQIPADSLVKLFTSELNTNHFQILKYVPPDRSNSRNFQLISSSRLTGDASPSRSMTGTYNSSVPKVQNKIIINGLSMKEAECRKYY